MVLPLGISHIIFCKENAKNRLIKVTYLLNLSKGMIREWSLMINYFLKLNYRAIFSPDLDQTASHV